MSRPSVYREHVECPHCHAKNPEPSNRYDDSREQVCLHCRGRFIVRQRMTYTTEALVSPEHSQSGEDFVTDAITDHTLPDSYAPRVALLFGEDVVAKDRSAGLWGLFMEEFPFLDKLREQRDHNFTLLSNNRSIRVYHPKGCDCAEARQKPV